MSRARILLRFAAMGVLLFSADRLLRAPIADAAPRRIVIEAASVESLSGPEIERLIDDEVLLREARALGIDRTDPVIAERLVRNVRFLDRDLRRERDDSERLEEAFALGLHESDIVVRRRLLQRMRAALAARASRPDEAELRAAYAAEPERFTDPARVSLRQVYFSGDSRGEGILEDARRVRARLLAKTVDPAEQGDPFLRGHEFDAASRVSLERRFGPIFANAAFRVSPGVWSEPVASSYGFHLVFVSERREATPLAFEAVRARIAAELVEQREFVALSENLDRLRERYRIEVAGR